MLKETVTNLPQNMEYLQFYKPFFLFFLDSSGRYGQIYGVTARSNLAANVFVGPFGPCSYTIKSAVAAAGIKKTLKENHIPEFETDLCLPPM